MSDDEPGERDRVDWMIPATEWYRFVKHCRAELDAFEGDVARHMDRAMREYSGQTEDLTAVEKQLTSLLADQGETDDPREEEKQKRRAGQRSLANAETTRIQKHVNPKVLAAFKGFVDKHADDSYGVEFARACRQYRTRPQASRVRSKLEAVLEISKNGADLSLPEQGTGADLEISKTDVDSSLPEEGTGEDPEPEPDLSTREKRVKAAAAEVRARNDAQNFHHEHLRSILSDFDQLSDEPADQTVSEYADDVAEELGLRQSPLCSELYVRPDDLPDRPNHVPWECWVPIKELDSETRARRIQLEAGYQAAIASSEGTTTLRVDEIHEDILDETVSKRTVHNDLEAVTETPGFVKESTMGGRKVLRIDLPTIVEAAPELWREIKEYRDGDRDDAEANAETETEANADADTEAEDVETETETEPEPETEPDPEPEPSPIEQIAANFEGKRGCLENEGISIVRESLADALEVDAEDVETDDLREVIDMAGLSDLFADDLAALENPYPHRAEPIEVIVEGE